MAAANMETRVEAEATGTIGGLGTWILSAYDEHDNVIYVEGTPTGPGSNIPKY